MKDLSKNNNYYECRGLSDEFEIPLFLIKNLKQDLEVVLKKYVSLNENNLRLKIKVLKDFKYVIDIECLTDFLLGGDNIY